VRASAVSPGLAASASSTGSCRAARSAPLRRGASGPGRARREHAEHDRGPPCAGARDALGGRGAAVADRPAGRPELADSRLDSSRMARATGRRATRQCARSSCSRRFGSSVSRLDGDAPLVRDVWDLKVVVEPRPASHSPAAFGPRSHLRRLPVRIRLGGPEAAVRELDGKPLPDVRLAGLEHHARDDLAQDAPLLWRGLLLELLPDADGSQEVCKAKRPLCFCFELSESRLGLLQREPLLRVRRSLGAEYLLDCCEFLPSLLDGLPERLAVPARPRLQQRADVRERERKHGMPDF